MAGTGLIAALLDVIGGEGSRRLPGDRPGSSMAVVPSRPSGIGRPRRVLMVIAPRDFYGLYYTAVRKQLDLRHVKCHVASTTMLECRSSEQGHHVTVAPDLMIDYARGADYDMIYFCGGEGCSIYADGGSHALQVRKLIEAALAAGRTVAAIGMAPVILAEAGVLRGRERNGDAALF